MRETALLRLTYVDGRYSIMDHVEYAWPASPDEIIVGRVAPMDPEKWEKVREGREDLFPVIPVNKTTSIDYVSDDMVTQHLRNALTLMLNQ